MTNKLTASFTEYLVSYAFCLNNFVFFVVQLNGFICTTWWFFSSQSDLRGPLNGSFGCVPHDNQFGEKCEHEVLGASNERFSVSAPDPYPSNLPQWLKTTEFGTTKTLTVKVCRVQLN